MKVKKKPVIVEAVKWDGNNFEEIEELSNNVVVNYVNRRHDEVIEISSTEGQIIAKKGDYIVKGIRGELYPVKPEIFDQTYEIMEE